jgi:hypothetical protein
MTTNETHVPLAMNRAEEVDGVWFIPYLCDPNAWEKSRVAYFVGGRHRFTKLDSERVETALFLYDPKASVTVALTFKTLLTNNNLVWDGTTAAAPDGNTWKCYICPTTNPARPETRWYCFFAGGFGGNPGIPEVDLPAFYEFAKKQREYARSGSKLSNTATIGRPYLGQWSLRCRGTTSRSGPRGLAIP